MNIFAIMKNSLFFKLFVCFIVSFLSLFIFSFPAFACTGVYVGSEVSEDGTIMIARSNDTNPINKSFVFAVYGGVDGYNITEINSPCGFKWKLPDKIYRTICTPSTSCTDTYSSKAAINECGVSVSATVTGYCSQTAIDANPYVKDGIDEMSIPLLIGCSCSTAREGVELLCRIIDEKGSCEDNILMISDQNEAFYMEIYSGHQYCAVKAPNDCVSVIGNEFMLETVDENSPDVYCSKDLFSLPEKAGFACYDKNGKMNLFDTYAGKDRFIDFSHMRTWRGHQLLAPSTIGDYSATTKYPLFFKPDEKVSLRKVMDIYRDRYEGTKYDLDINGKDTYRAISIEESQSTQILQTYKHLPANMCIVDWVAFSNAEFNVYVPCSNLEANFDNSYIYNPENYFNVDEFCAFDMFKRLNTLCAQNRKLLSKGVKEYWSIMEEYITTMMPRILWEASESKNKNKIIDDFCTNIQNQLFYDARRLYDDAMWHLMYTDRNYSKKVDLIKLTEEPWEQPQFNAYIDLVLFANMFGWKIELDKKEAHDFTLENQSDKQIYHEPFMIYLNDTEGVVRISKNGNVIEVCSNGGSKNSTGRMTINNNVEAFNAKTYDGKLFADISILDKLVNIDKNYEYHKINNKYLSSKRSFNGFNIYSSIFIPVWLLLFIIGITLIIVVAIIYVFWRVSNKRKLNL